MAKYLSNRQRTLDLGISSYTEGSDVLTVTGNTIISGVTTSSGGFVGDVTGDLTGNVYATSGISTFNNIDIGGSLTDINDSTGTSGYVLKTVGTGVSWADITDVLPETRTTQTFSASAGQTAFNFNYNVNYLDVYLNGVKLSSSEFTATNGTSVTLSEAAFAGDTVELVSYNTAATGVGSVNSLNDLTDVTLTGSSTGNILSYNGSGWVNTSTLSGITALDSTTTSTIESAIAAAPNNFTSLNITNSGIATFSGDIDANGDVDIAGTLSATSLSGPLTGNVTGNADTASALATARTIGLSGDVSGSASFDGSANVTITATVADDSHNHIISNVDGLQDALDLKAPLASPALTGTPTAPTAAAGTNTTQVATTAFVSTAVSNLVDTAPAALDTLNELAAALGDDPNFATSVSTSIGTKLDSADYTASDVLTKIKTVDGSGSGLDADTVDGIQASSFLRSDANDTATGIITIQNTNDYQLSLDGGSTTWAGISFDDSSNQTDYIWYNGANKTFAIGGGGANVAGKKLHVDGGLSVGASADSTSTPSNGIYSQGDISVGGNTVWHAGNDGSGSGLDADLLDGINSTGFLNSSNTATGDMSTNGNISSGRGSGGVALTINDGYGNANVTWNHEDGVPEQNGNSARIEVNTDSSTNATMYFELKSGVSGGSAVSLNNGMTLTESSLTVNGNINSSSDARLKTNITTLTNSLDKVLSLRGVEYDRIDNEGIHQIGVIAQEVEEVVPDIVSTDDNGMKSVAYGHIAPLLIEAIKEQQKQIEALKAEIAELKK